MDVCSTELTEFVSKDAAEWKSAYCRYLAADKPRQLDMMEKDMIAYIFDFDGVLVNTMPAHFRCYREACAEAGVEIDEEQFYRQAGMIGVEQISYFARKCEQQVDAQAVYKRKKEIYVDHIDLAGLIYSNYVLINSLHSAGIKVAIASGSSRASMLPLTEKFNIPFDAMVLKVPFSHYFGLTKQYLISFQNRPSWRAF